VGCTRRIKRFATPNYAPDYLRHASFSLSRATLCLQRRRSSALDSVRGGRANLAKRLLTHALSDTLAGAHAAKDAVEMN